MKYWKKWVGPHPHPLKHVDDFSENLPSTWKEHGGVFIPMYQSEAMWINFHGGDYPFAVKIAAGKVNALTGQPWSNDLSVTTSGGEVLQDYLVVPDQPWLDGFAIEKGVIRQFVAMPLGEGYTAEEQLTDEAQHGGIQIVCYPIKRKHYHPEERSYSFENAKICGNEIEMGLGLGGRMKQEIFKDKYGLEKWDTTNSSRCFVHIANSSQYRSITGDHPPTQPPTAEQYNKAGLPWFDYYDENQTAQAGSPALDGLKSVGQMGGGDSAGKAPIPGPIVLTPDLKKKC